MKNTMLKLLALLGTGCFLLGVTLAAETNKHQPRQQEQHPQQQSGRAKRGLLSALFGGGDEPEPVRAAEVPTEVLPIYGDPAQPPLHMLYGHATGFPGPYPPYPVMFVPGPPALNDGSPAGSGYLPVLSYGGVGGPAQFQPAGDSNYLPAVIGWTPDAHATPPASPPVVEATTATAQDHGPSVKPTAPGQQTDGPKSAYLQKLNLSPADEAELKRLAKQLGVTDFEHLPPFEDVMALLGTTGSGETIKAIKEYASTPDGLELIKDYVMSYQPAKRISLGQEPYTENGIGDGGGDDDDADSAAADTPSSTPAPAPEAGFFAHHLRRLKSLLTFGYFGGDPVAPVEPVKPLPESPPLVPVEVSSEAPFVRNDFPAFEVRDGGVRGVPVPVAHYLIPIRTLPQHRPPYADYKYASSVPFPMAVHYPSEAQYPNPFTATRHVADPAPEGQQHSRLLPLYTATAPSEASHRDEAVAPQRAAPATPPTGEVHTFERADIEQTGRTSSTVSPGGQVAEPVEASGTTFAPIVVAPEEPEVTELSTNALDEQEH